MQAGRWKFLPSALVLTTVAVVLALSAPLSARAMTTYIYEGENFDFILDNDPTAGSFTKNMHISVTAIFANPLSVNLDRRTFGPMPAGQLVEFTMTAGRFDDDDLSLTALDMDGTFVISTNGLGEIIEWDVLIDRTIGSTKTTLATHFFIEAASEGFDYGDLCTTAPNCGDDLIDHGSIEDSKGSWRVVPEASTGVLLGGGLVGLAASRRRLK